MKRRLYAYNALGTVCIAAIVVVIADPGMTVIARLLLGVLMAAPMVICARLARRERGRLEDSRDRSSLQGE